jgi:hypothetical protein
MSSMLCAKVGSEPSRASEWALCHLCSVTAAGATTYRELLILAARAGHVLRAFGLQPSSAWRYCYPTGSSGQPCSSGRFASAWWPCG